MITTNIIVVYSKCLMSVMIATFNFKIVEDNI